jgi:hypothetical protein
VAGIKYSQGIVCEVLHCCQSSSQLFVLQIDIMSLSIVMETTIRAFLSNLFKSSLIAGIKARLAAKIIGESMARQR